MREGTEEDDDDEEDEEDEQEAEATETVYLLVTTFLLRLARDVATFASSCSPRAEADIAEYEEEEGSSVLTMVAAVVACIFGGEAEGEGRGSMSSGGTHMKRLLLS